MMLWKWCTQHVSKFGELSSGHRTGKGQFSYQSQRRAMPKNIQTYHTLISHASKVIVKILQARFQQFPEPRTSRCKSWIYKRQRNQRSNCQHLLDHRKIKRIPEKYLLLLHWLCWSLWLCRSQQTVENSETDENIPDHPTCLLRNLYAGQEATVRIGHQKWTGSKLGKEYIKAVYCHLACSTYMQST